jgi:decaprenylphospho-beta-D-erythro-pentofuranosid-2-ulose 2-reductase
MKRVLIVGATSAIAEACARRFAQRGDALALAGRDGNRLAAIAADLRVRGARRVHVECLDVNSVERHGALIDAVERALEGLDLVLIAHGSLTEQAAAQRSVELQRSEFMTNALSAMSLCTHLANRFESRGDGCIAVISSVAGDRGRASNYVYGAAKAALSAYLSGLRQRLAPSGVHVLTVKPGFVDTPMTAAFKKGPLWATPQKVAADIVYAIERRQQVLYTPWFWRWIMTLIRLIPERLFMRLRGL